jgi:hypothetical protein
MWETATDTASHYRRPEYPIAKLKSKTIPLHPWTGPEGSRRLRLPDFKTLAT